MPAAERRLTVPFSNTIEAFVGRLRRKLCVDVIETVRGQGYRLRPLSQLQP